MLVFWDQRLVFLATPKAGSTAIESALEPLASFGMQRPEAMKHLSATDFRRYLAPLLRLHGGDDFATVALMREPVSWVQSWYRFRLRDDRDDPSHPMIGKSFEDFVADFLAEEPPPHARLGSQSEFLGDGDGGLRVDRVFRYEDMDQFVHFLEDRLDCIVTLPRVNVPPSVDVRLSDAARTRLLARLKDDVDLYQAIPRA